MLLQTIKNIKPSEDSKGNHITVVTLFSNKQSTTVSSLFPIAELFVQLQMQGIRCKALLLHKMFQTSVT